MIPDKRTDAEDLKTMINETLLIYTYRKLYLTLQNVQFSQVHREFLTHRTYSGP